MSNKFIIQPQSNSQSSLNFGATPLSSRLLPVTVLLEAKKRLVAASLVMMSIWVILLLVGHCTPGPQAEAYSAINSIAHILGAVIIVFSLIMILMTRTERLDPQLVLDIGLVYAVICSFLISLIELWSPLTEGVKPWGISWVAFWIATYPLVVPCTPGKTLLTGFLSACMGPMALLITIARGNPQPPFSITLFMFLPNYIAVAVAFVLSRIVYRLGRDAHQAQEMGGYQLVELLGRGGMGEVWKAKHRLLARPTAIKLVRPDTLGQLDGKTTENILRRFKREAYATSGLQSPHTIQIYDFGITEDGTFYQVMEHLEGMNMASMISHYGAIPPERVIYMLRQVCSSLAEAHWQGMIHRDIKPANLFICHKGLEYDFVKVLDFGLVKTSKDITKDETQLSMAGQVFGTPNYIAPEISSGEDNVDSRADIYSLGCVAYRMVTGVDVFDGKTPMQIILSHVKTPPTPPSQRIDADVPPDLERIIISCLAKSPDDRPQTAIELDRILAACKVAPWTQEHARSWWQQHINDALDDQTQWVEMSS